MSFKQPVDKCYSYRQLTFHERNIRGCQDINENTFSIDQLVHRERQPNQEIIASATTKKGIQPNLENNVT